MMSVEPNLILITIASVSGAIGIGLLFVGLLMTILIALGNKHYIAGIIALVFLPAAYVYCAYNRENTAYAAKLLYFGAIFFVIFIGLMWWELSRLGLDFFDVMRTTKPVH